MNRNYKLGDDLITKDDILEGISFEELISTVEANCEEVTPQTVEQTLKEILNYRLKDMNFLLQNNIQEIINLVNVS